jgi:hypothetical protein
MILRILQPDRAEPIRYLRQNKIYDYFLGVFNLSLYEHRGYIPE